MYSGDPIRCCPSIIYTAICLRGSAYLHISYCMIFINLKVFADFDGWQCWQCQLDSLLMNLCRKNMLLLFTLKHGLRTPRESLFFKKSQTFGPGQTFWSELFWGIWAIFGQIIGTILALWVPYLWENVFGFPTKTLVFRPT